MCIRDSHRSFPESVKSLSNDTRDFDGCNPSYPKEGSLPRCGGRIEQTVSSPSDAEQPSPRTCDRHSETGGRDRPTPAVEGDGGAAGVDPALAGTASHEPVAASVAENVGESEAHLARSLE